MSDETKEMNEQPRSLDGLVVPRPPVERGFQRYRPPQESFTGYVERRHNRGIDVKYPPIAILKTEGRK